MDIKILKCLSIYLSGSLLPHGTHSPELHFYFVKFKEAGKRRIINLHTELLGLENRQC